METTEIKKKITDSRIDIQEEKAKAEKLGERSKTILPEDLEVMFAGKNCLNIIKQKVATENALWAYLREYLGLEEDEFKRIKTLVSAGSKKSREKLEELDISDTFKRLLEMKDDFEASFSDYKKKAEKIANKHPLCEKMSGIKGLTAYQIAMVMAIIKDVNKFNTPSKLMVYAGLASINGMPVTKANINKIRKVYLDQGKEFKGFNTVLSGRMFVIVDCVLRGRGVLFEMYNNIRNRIHERCVNQDEVDEVEQKDGTFRYYMKGKKKQSLESFTNTNARRRIARIILHTIYTEWRTLRGLETRNPYAVDYLGHDTYLKLEDIIDKK